MLVIDSRAARVLDPGRRAMVDDDEWEWIVDHSRGDFDHLVVASTLPVYMPKGIHHLEAWNEAVCAGAWGGLAARLGEKLRRALDLEHWSAFHDSFVRLSDWLCRIADGADGHPPPATIVLLGGDVHNAYVNEVALPVSADSASRVFQIVCSPFRNPLGAMQRRAVKLVTSRPSAALFARLARLAGVKPTRVDWRLVREPSFHNSLGELVLEGRGARVTLYRSADEGENTERIHRLDVTELRRD